MLLSTWFYKRKIMYYDRKIYLTIVR